MTEAANIDFTLALNEPGREYIAALDSDDSFFSLVPEPRSDDITLLKSIPVGFTLISD
jgi:hypothetical protein